MLAACGHSSIRVVGVMQQSSEFRPLPSVPLGGYQQLHVLVRAAPGQAAERYGSPDCGFAKLEGTSEGQDLNNAACVPVEALGAALGIVRQRLRTYGIAAVRSASEPYDYKVEVSVTGEAPESDRGLAKAVATVTFTLHSDAGEGTLVGGIDRKAAAAAFPPVSKDCAFKDADFSSFSASSRQPMIPEFDVVALASDAVDNVLRCNALAHFFLDAHTLFPKTGGPVAP